jgi:hypothetical protein
LASGGSTVADNLTADPEVEGSNTAAAWHQGQCYKTFLSIIYEFSQSTRMFVPDKLYQPILTDALALYKNLEMLYNIGPRRK